MKQRRWVFLLTALLLAAPADAAAPTVDLHELEWFVHVDLIDAGAGRDLAFYEALLDDTMAQASAWLEGDQGPADTPCCTRLRRAVSVAIFGSTGDGLDVLDSAAEYSTLAGLGLPGSQAFLVDSITHCGGTAPTAIGCAMLPSCDSNPNDDPNRWLVVTMDAFDGNNLVQVLAHERGHNACLTHVDVDECQLMRPGGGGGCLDATECANFQAGRTTTGSSCSCHDTDTGALGDGQSCSEVAEGLCSGGVCGDPAGPGATQVLASGGPGNGAGEVADDALLMSGLTGGWSNLGAFGTSSQVVEGLAYATDSSTLYGVVPSGADDLIVTIDPTSGAITATVGVIANGTDALVALAYNPGPSSAPSDDLLLALETDFLFETLVTINPAAPNVTTVVGPLAFGAGTPDFDGFRGLAYDPGNGKLYTSSGFQDGIYEIDFTNCSPLCALNRQIGLGLARFDAGLSYSPDTGLLHLVGSQSGVLPLGERTLYNVVDPNTFAVTTEKIQVDAFTAAGLAAVPLPVPEPDSTLALLIGSAALLSFVRGSRGRAR